MEKKNNRKNEVNNVLLGIVSLIVIAIFAILGYLHYSTRLELKGLKEELKVLTGETVDTSKKDTASNNNAGGSDVTNVNQSKKCNNLDGKYYGELVEGNLHMKQTYVFSSDGSYITWIENSEGNNGYYLVANGSVYFMQKSSMGPSNVISTYYFEISDDCKTLTAYSEGNSYTLTKVE